MKAQIAKWLELAQSHLNNRDFGAARNAAAGNAGDQRADARALDLLEKIESTETDAQENSRAERAALQFSSKGIPERRNLDRPGQAGAFVLRGAGQSECIDSGTRSCLSELLQRSSIRTRYHSQLRSRMRNASSGRRISPEPWLYAEDLLSKYPNDGTFQALKIRIEDAERQELSSYTAELSNRLEAERDLDRRVNIAKEACERYPNEAQFAQQLKLVRERRDLVNSIVVKARQYEERGQFAEAISQWDILRNIHPDYPGIAFELEQIKKKRDQQGQEEERSRLVNEIDALMKSRAYAKAIECASSAFRNSLVTPSSGLKTLAEQGLERTKESRRLFEEGQRCAAQGDLQKATELLRSSLNLDPRAPGLRDAVINVLVEQARAFGEDNWQAPNLCVRKPAN